ncbi:hypothetical protein [Ruminococcus sp.]|uniref:hypothetical protein n=1 Tax=Ruminococcus sp. TaxID=41978 RepID=UPI00388D5841
MDYTNFLILITLFFLIIFLLLIRLLKLPEFRKEGDDQVDDQDRSERDREQRQQLQALHPRQQKDIDRDTYDERQARADQDERKHPCSELLLTVIAGVLLIPDGFSRILITINRAAVRADRQPKHLFSP